MQPVPLYPLMTGYVLGYSTNFGANSHFCMTVVVFLMIYQVASMIACFVRKHQTIAGILKKYSMPIYLVFGMLLYVAVFTVAVPGIYSTLSVTEASKWRYVEKNYPEYLPGFKTVPTFSIYEVNSYFIKFVICTVAGAILAFLALVTVISNIFRMLNILKSQISKSTYQKHRAAVYSLIAQFLTSAVIFLPPIFLVFVVLIRIERAQLIVDALLVIACLHSSLNVIVLVITFPPYRKFVFLKLSFKPSSILPKPSPMVSNIAHN